MAVMADIGPKQLDSKELVHLARLALSGRIQDVSVYLTRLAKKLQVNDPAAANQINELLASRVTSDAPFRSAAEVPSVIPRDADSRLQLLRVEDPPVLPVDPIWSPSIQASINQLVLERSKQSELLSQGLAAARSILFTGPPGVGKSLAAKHIACTLDRPLATLDLSAVMSSFLGKTGSNLRYVLDYAKEAGCILFLDELDAVAKRRDDSTEIGELKRLVTVLLQEIDDWPSSGLLIAATNHPVLLDPAVWRRFDMIVDFPMPSPDEVRQATASFIGARIRNPDLVEVAALALEGSSFSDIARDLQRLIKQSVMESVPLEDVLRGFIRSKMAQLKPTKRKVVASCFLAAGFGQRETHEWTGVHRDTIRKMERASE